MIRTSARHFPARVEWGTAVSTARGLIVSAFMQGCPGAEMPQIWSSQPYAKLRRRQTGRPMRS